MNDDYQPTESLLNGDFSCETTEEDFYDYVEKVLDERTTIAKEMRKLHRNHIENKYSGNTDCNICDCNNYPPSECESHFLIKYNARCRKIDLAKITKLKPISKFDYENRN